MTLAIAHSSFVILGTVEGDPELFAAFETIIGERAISSDMCRHVRLRECRAVVQDRMHRATKRQRQMAPDQDRILRGRPNGVHSESALATLEPCSAERLDTSDIQPTPAIRVLT